MKVLLPTTNEIKIEKWGGLIKDLGYELVTLKDLDMKFEEPKEDGNSILENAIKKAEYYYKKTGLVTVTTDSSLYIDGLSKEEQIGLFAGRKIIRDDSGNIINEEKLTNEENYQRLKNILESLGEEVNGYFEEGIVIYYGTNTYESKSFKMDRLFKTPGSSVIKEKAPMRSFTYYPQLNKYRSEMTNQEANEVEDETFESQKEFFSESLYKIDHLMEYNFKILMDRVIDANVHLTEENLSEVLKNIKNSCLCIGTGGSLGACAFASKIISLKNKFNHKILSNYCEPLTFLQKDIDVENVLAITYGNNNPGINEALEKARKEGLSTYILTSNDKNNMEDNIIHYPLCYSKEYSFISLASTLTPMSIMLRYYLNAEDAYDALSFMYQLYNKYNEVNFLQDHQDIFNDMKVIEIISDYNTESSARILESTIVEAGLGFPIVHDKYGYFHGRSVLSSHHSGNILIYLLNGEKAKIDEKLTHEIKKQNSYEDIIFLTTNSKDKIMGDLDLSMQVSFLCKSIALSMNKSLSKVEYPRIVRRLYPYNGGLI